MLPGVSDHVVREVNQRVARTAESQEVVDHAGLLKRERHGLAGGVKAGSATRGTRHTGWLVGEIEREMDWHASKNLLRVCHPDDILGVALRGEGDAVAQDKLVAGKIRRVMGRPDEGLQEGLAGGSLGVKRHSGCPTPEVRGELPTVRGQGTRARQQNA